MSEESLHRELCRRQHRILGLDLLLQAWVNQVDALIVEREEMSSFLGITRFKSSRLEWLKEDLKSYFRYQHLFYRSGSPDSLHSFVLSRVPLDEMPTSSMISEERAAAARALELRMEVVVELETFDQHQTESDLYTFVSLLAAGLTALPEVTQSYEDRHAKKNGSSEKSVGELGLWKISKCMKQRDLQEIEAAITVCFSHAQIDSQVETLDNAARKGFASFEIVHQQFLVSSEGLDEFLHRFESAAHGALTPSPEEPAGPVGAFVLPEGIEGFL